MGFFNKFIKEGPQQSLEEEVVDSICDLLNTRISFGAFQRDLGMNTYIFSSPNLKVVKQIIQDITTCLEKYETRMTITNIQPAPSKDDFSLRFVIHCKIQKKPHSFQFSFEPHQKQFKRGGDL